MRLKLSETLKEIAAAVADRSAPDLGAIQEELNSVQTIYPYLTLQVRCLTYLIVVLQHNIADTEPEGGLPFEPDGGFDKVDGRERMPVYRLLLQIAKYVHQQDRAALLKLGANMVQAQKRIAGADKMAPAMQALIDSCRDLVGEASWQRTDDEEIG